MKSKIDRWILQSVPFFILWYAFSLFVTDTYHTAKHPYELVNRFFTVRIFISYALAGKLGTFVNQDWEIVSFTVAVLAGYLVLVMIGLAISYMLIVNAKKYLLLACMLALFGVCMVGTIRYYTQGGHCGFFVYNCHRSWHWDWNVHGHLIGVSDIRNDRGEHVPSERERCQYHGSFENFDALIMKIDGMKRTYNDDLTAEYMFPEGDKLTVDKKKWKYISFGIEPGDYKLREKVNRVLFEGTYCAIPLDDQYYTPWFFNG